jgi:hypothetical protein
MQRRTFLTICCILILTPTIALADKYKKFEFKIKTKTGSRIGLTQQGTDIDDAKTKVRKRYPDCEFLSSKEIK